MISINYFLFSITKSASCAHQICLIFLYAIRAIMSVICMWINHHQQTFHSMNGFFFCFFHFQSKIEAYLFTCHKFMVGFLHTEYKKWKKHHWNVLLIGNVNCLVFSWFGEISTQSILHSMYFFLTNGNHLKIAVYIYIYIYEVHKRN